MLTRQTLTLPALIALGSLLAACGESSGGGGSGSGSGGSGNGGDNGSGGSATGIAQSGFETESSQRWSWAHPLPQSYGLQSVISDGQQFHAVGTNGTYMTSPTGDNWTVRHFPADLLADIAWNGANTFVAVGESGLNGVEGLIAYSTNGGADWQPAELPDEPGRFNEVVWTGNNFVAVTADGGMVATSPNGVSWTLSENDEMMNVGALANQGSTLVGGGTQGAYYSEDGGATWAPVTGAISGSSSIRAFEYLNGQFIGIGGYQLGGFLTSSNGADWSREDDDFDYVYQGSFADSFTFSAVTQLGDHYWVSDIDGNIHRRDLDAPNWTQPVASSLGFIASMATRNDALLAVGTQGRLVRARAADDIEELKKTPLGEADFTAMVQDDSGNILIGTEDGDVWLSEDDGVTWDNATVIGGGAIVDLAFSGYGFVAVGSGFMASSPDGLNWTVEDSIEQPDFPGTAMGFDSVAATIDGWVAIANNNVAVCTLVTDCEFLDRNTPASGMSRIVHDGHHYVLVNFSGGVFRSVDGLDWSRAFTAEGNLSTVVASAEAMVIAPSSTNVQDGVYVSTDLGVTWESARFPEGADILGGALSVSDNTFYLYSTGDYTLWTSPDGLDWEPEYAPHVVYDTVELAHGQLMRGMGNRLFKRLVEAE